MNKTKIMTFRRVSALLGLALLVALSIWRVGLAQSVVQSYKAGGTLERGMIIGLDAKDPTKVAALTNDTINRMHGVIVDPNDAPVALSQAGQDVFVATTGKYDVLVSDQNGGLKAGDYVSISSVAGIGQKANDQQNYVIGKALTGFNGKTGVVSVTQVKNGQGTSDVSIGRVTVDIGVSRNPTARPLDQNIPTFLRRASEAVSQKPVTALKMYSAATILAITVAITASMLFAGTRSSILAIGRNPLGKGSIMRGLLEVIIGSIIIFIVGLFIAFLLLRH
ncbi:MAG: rane protein of unknown function [Candidatus Saccharibacteria bacterium]|nr:rane protein of unknown function [Candidatus Saccharibacteria bacterium]